MNKEEIRYDSLGRRIGNFDRSAAGKKTRDTLKRRYGEDHYKKLAITGGKSRTRGHLGKLKDEGKEKELKALSRKAVEARQQKKKINARNYEDWAEL